MKLKEIAGFTAGSPVGDIEITGITCDSRQVREGHVFVCIGGTNEDGHKYAQPALSAGASVIVCERDLGLENQVIVEEARVAYAEMCAEYFGRPAEKLHLVGITGTNGKTTTTYLIKSLLENAGHKVGLIGSIKNVIGNETLPAKNTTPDAYELHSLFSLMRKAGCDYVIMEVSSHALDQERVYGLHFDTAVFTNLTQDHLDYHGSMEAYLAAKKKLFFMCDTAVINIDDPYADAIIEDLDCKIVTCSAKSDHADYIAKGIRYKADGVIFEMVSKGLIERIKLKTPGTFSVYNGLEAGVAAITLGVPFDQAAEGLSLADGVKGRVEVVPTGKDFTVVIDFAHTPDALENILKMFREVKNGRLVTLFGCGGDRDKGKRPIMGGIAAELSDFVVVTSDNPRSEEPSEIIDGIAAGMKGTGTPYKIIENRREAIFWAVQNAEPQDVIVLAGKGHETYQVLKDGTIHFDEREVVAEALGK